MNSQQAKEFLMRHRPVAGAPLEPDLAEALEQVKQDPDLARWFERHQMLQSVIRDRLRQISPPADLKDRILAGMAGEKIVWWRNPVFQGLAAAATIALAATLAWSLFQPREDNSFPAYREAMVRGVQRLYGMDIETNDVEAIRGFLAGNNGHADYQAPAGLERLPHAGCAIMRWRNKRVSMVCYESGSETDLFYLLVVNRDEFTDAPPDEPPLFDRIGRLTAASWSRGDKTYILAGSGDANSLRQYLSPP